MPFLYARIEPSLVSRPYDRFFSFHIIFRYSELMPSFSISLSETTPWHSERITEDSRHSGSFLYLKMIFAHQALLYLICLIEVHILMRTGDRRLALASRFTFCLIMSTWPSLICHIVGIKLVGVLKKTYHRQTLEGILDIFQLSTRQQWRGCYFCLFLSDSNVRQCLSSIKDRIEVNCQALTSLTCNGGGVVLSRIGL